VSETSDGAKPLNTLLPPRRLWWGRIGPDERLWLTVAFAWCLLMFTAMIVWQNVGEQTIPVESYKVDRPSSEPRSRVTSRRVRSARSRACRSFVPRPGEDVYLQAMQFQFRPVLELQKGQTYRLLDLLDRRPARVSLSKPATCRASTSRCCPGYLYVVRITPQETGDFPWSATSSAGSVIT
jgi:cytochrome c oxidase subunit II